MSKSKIIPLVVEEHSRNGWQHFGEWRTKDAGPANDTNLSKYRKLFVDSTRKGGCNEHLGFTGTGNLRVRRQKDGAILAVFTAPVFEVLA